MDNRWEVVMVVDTEIIPEVEATVIAEDGDREVEARSVGDMLRDHVTSISLIQ